MKKVFLLIIIITIFCGLFADNLVRIDWDDYNNAVNILRSLDVAGFSKDNYYEIFVQRDNKISFVLIFEFFDTSQHR